MKKRENLNRQGSEERIFISIIQYESNQSIKPLQLHKITSNIFKVAIIFGYKLESKFMSHVSLSLQTPRRYKTINNFSCQYGHIPHIYYTAVKCNYAHIIYFTSVKGNYVHIFYYATVKRSYVYIFYYTDVKCASILCTI